MPKLIIAKKEGTDVADLLDQNILGRGLDTTIRIDDIQASRKHCKISKSEEGYLLEDMGSGNGTFVNGKFTKQCLLKEGDQIKIGGTIITFTDGAIKLDQQGKAIPPKLKIDPNLVKGETIRTFVAPPMTKAPPKIAPAQAQSVPPAQPAAPTQPTAPARPPTTRMPAGAPTSRSLAGMPTARIGSPTTKVGGSPRTSRTATLPPPKKKSPVMLIISILLVVGLGVAAFFVFNKPKTEPGPEDERDADLILKDIISQKIDSPYGKVEYKNDRDNAPKYLEGLYEAYTKIYSDILNADPKDEKKNKWLKETKVFKGFQKDVITLGKHPIYDYSINFFDWGKLEKGAREKVSGFLAKTANPPEQEIRKLYDEATTLAKQYAYTTFQFKLNDAVKDLEKKLTTSISSDEIGEANKLAEKVNKEYLPNEKFSQAVKEIKEFLAKATKDIVKTPMQELLSKVNSAAKTYLDKVLKDVEGYKLEDALNKLREAKGKLEGTDCFEELNKKLTEKENEARKQGSQSELPKEEKKENKPAEPPKEEKK